MNTLPLDVGALRARRADVFDKRPYEVSCQAAKYVAACYLPSDGGDFSADIVPVSGVTALVVVSARDWPRRGDIAASVGQFAANIRDGKLRFDDTRWWWQEYLCDERSAARWKRRLAVLDAALDLEAGRMCLVNVRHREADLIGRAESYARGRARALREVRRRLEVLEVPMPSVVYGYLQESSGRCNQLDGMLDRVPHNTLAWLVWEHIMASQDVVDVDKHALGKPGSHPTALVQKERLKHLLKEARGDRKLAWQMLAAELGGEMIRYLFVAAVERWSSEHGRYLILPAGILCPEDERRGEPFLHVGHLRGQWQSVFVREHGETIWRTRWEQTRPRVFVWQPPQISAESLVGVTEHGSYDFSPLVAEGRPERKDAGKNQPSAAD